MQFTYRCTTIYADNNFMKINLKKTKVMQLNPQKRSLDFKPEVRLRGDLIDVTNQIRLVAWS